MSTTSNTSNTSTSQTTKPPQSPHATVLGIYGVSGCGKSYLAKQLKAQLDDSFVFYEGSDELAKRVSGDLDTFKQMDKDAQDVVRDQTIEGIRDECAAADKTGIITGHYMFWNANTPSSGDGAQIAMTDVDKKIYTHILYLKTSPEIVVQQVAKDATRKRHPFDAATIQECQTQEEQQLRSICQDNDILFATIRPDSLSQAVKYAQSTIQHNESTNESLIKQAVDHLIEALPVGEVKTMLVLDADGTLGPHDASKLYYTGRRLVKRTRSKHCSPSPWPTLTLLSARRAGFTKSMQLLGKVAVSIIYAKKQLQPSPSIHRCTHFCRGLVRTRPSESLSFRAVFRMPGERYWRSCNWVRKC